MNRKIVFGISAVALVAAFIIASSLYKSERAKKLGFMAQENASTFVRDHSPIRGDDAAKVYIVEFTDPACETCAAFSDFVKQLMAAYPGKIKLVIRYAPFHHGSVDVVRILANRRVEETLQWDDHTMTFRGWTYPLEQYSRALEAVGLRLDLLREPGPSDPPDRYARWQTVPLFLMFPRGEVVISGRCGRRSVRG